MQNYKFVLVSVSGYKKEHDKLLKSLLNQKNELFCVVGKDCEVWEEIMDELSVGDGSNPLPITTTSHPDESITDVIGFAQMFKIEKESGVEVVRI
ncbi:hypothetical protein [Motilimonas sp. E26]|uniref:hypothetical protein n=1 Tax=Motilimonas sp. E26 TaxID=2865674 RepID=UPI001E3A3459|nr:hypothetical protein [Motilimonas sp. E26]MCE0557490.1 hypothetical protein [Motilimonas sp. E26]